jgi:hypothetical protein
MYKHCPDKTALVIGHCPMGTAVRAINLATFNAPRMQHETIMMKVQKCERSSFSPIHKTRARMHNDASEETSLQRIVVTHVCGQAWQVARSLRVSRAGREPAEDVKRRLVYICREAGLKVTTARMYLRREEGDRLILIGATRPTSQDERWLISIITVVSTNGDWSGELDIRCSISPEELLTQTRSSLVMRGRNAIPFEDLARQLRETLEEREQVMAALNLGVEGPYTFRRARWEDPLDVK